ncbi:MAG: peptidoglycan editing factor PgeF [Alphaproteobacteria bacterium]|nr:peptidoglycan editing factor PgeF [Rhodospirillales bacterium]MCW9045115.1 peptidoglycan editing factor PgeF [Alphaproteobacteria bacterium]
MITVAALNEITAIRHGFMTREGGVSEGVFASLNCGFGSGDDIEKVAANRAIAMEQLDLPKEALVTVKQIHSNKVVIVEKLWEPDDAPEADAMVSNVWGIALGILTADCVPVLFADGKAGVVGAAHAGWKGALSGVLKNTVEAMEELGAKRSNIIAAIGPCITQRSYEVGGEFLFNFLAEDDNNRLFFNNSRTEGYFMFDLVGYVSKKLGEMMVKEIISTPCDTYSEERRFFSYRRTCHIGESDFGRGLSAIALSR